MRNVCVLFPFFCWAVAQLAAASVPVAGLHSTAQRNRGPPAARRGTATRQATGASEAGLRRCRMLKGAGKQALLRGERRHITDVVGVSGHCGGVLSKVLHFTLGGHSGTGDLKSWRLVQEIDVHKQ